jgi:branched-chain amino acid transport system ATP-binding protein
METVTTTKEKKNLLLKVVGVSKTFGAHRALHNVSFDMEQGDRVALIGPNGAGKTTLVNIITGALQPDTGSVHFRGQDITGSTLAEAARRGIIRVFQKPRIFPNLSVWENVLIGCLASSGSASDEIEKQVNMLLEAVGLKEDKFTQAGSLTFANKRFLELIRAFGAKPHLLILDEPAAGLSPTGQELLVEFLNAALDANRSHLLFIEHSPAVISALATKYVILNSGVKVYEGIAKEEATEEAIDNLYVRGGHVSSN